MAIPGAARQPFPATQEKNPGRAPVVPPAAGSPGLDAYLQSLADEILLFAGGDGVAIALPHKGELYCRATSGIAPPLGTRIDARSGLTGACLSTGTLLRCDDSEQDARVDRQVCRALGIRSMVCVPVTAGQEVVGIFEIFSSRAKAFLNVDVSGLHAKAQRVAGAFTAEQVPAQNPMRAAAADPTVSWTPVSRPGPRRRRPHLSAKTWQAVLGALVLAVGLFLFVRAIRAPEPAESAITQPSASAAAVGAETAPAVETHSNFQRRLRSQARPQTAFSAEQILTVKPASVRAGASLDPAVPQPPPVLIAGGAPANDVLPDLVNSLPVTQPTQPDHLRVSSGVPQPVLLHRVEPLYPVLARQNRVEGSVVLEALVNQEGEVTNLRVDSGNSLLVGSALRAVRQWRYRTPRLNGEPIAVPIKIVLKFELGK